MRRLGVPSAAVVELHNHVLPNRAHHGLPCFLVRGEGRTGRNRDSIKKGAFSNPLCVGHEINHVGNRLVERTAAETRKESLRSRKIEYVVRGDVVQRELEFAVAVEVASLLPVEFQRSVEESPESVDVAVYRGLSHVSVAGLLAVEFSEPPVVRIEVRLDCVVDDYESLKHLLVEDPLCFSLGLFHGTQYTTTPYQFVIMNFFLADIFHKNQRIRLRICRFVLQFCNFFSSSEHAIIYL